MVKLRLLRGALLALALVAAGPVPVGPAAATTQAQGPEQRARLIQYSSETELKALAAEGKTVVFFFATWCPNCILTLTEMSEKWSEIEPDITLVIADYDTETALKVEYGVTYQDTFVLLDSSAKAAKLWNAGGVAGLNANTRTE